MHESPRTPCRYQLCVRIYACTTSTAFTLAPCWHQIRMHHINSLHFSHLLLLSTTANQPSLHSPFLLVLSFSHNHPLPSLLAVCSFFLGFAFSSLDVHCRNIITGHRGAWHFRLEKAQKLSSDACPISIRKELSQGRRPSKWRSQAGNWQASQAGTGKHAQAGHWQTFPGRELAKRPRQGLQNVPRQGTGERSQAGNWQASQAGTASMPRQGMHTGKRSQAGNWQASQAGTANVPRQGTGKCSQAGNRRRAQAGDSGCSHAGNCRHCKSLAAICHQPRGATPPPTSRVLCDELACLLTGRGAKVNTMLTFGKSVTY